MTAYYFYLAKLWSGLVVLELYVTISGRGEIGRRTRFRF